MKNGPGHRILFRLAILAGCALALQPAQASDYPERPIRMMVPYPTGGVGDTLGRLLSSALSARLGHTVVVENRPGANGNIGASQVVRAAPDGHTLMISYNGTMLINPLLYRKMDFDTFNDFTPISNAVTYPFLIVTNPAVPARTLKELVAYAKANPGKVAYGSSAGSGGHLIGALFANQNGIDLNFVAYKGSAQAVVDLAAGQIQVMFDTQSNVATYLADGRLRALAVASDKRLPDLPQVETVVEAGFPGLVAEGWFGVYGPKSMPPKIVDRLNREISSIVTSADMVEKLRIQGFQPAPSPSSAAFRAFMEAEMPKWSAAVKASGVPQQ